MAVKKKRRGVIKAPPPPPAEGADDLQVLHPNCSAKIAGRAVTVREYGFVEGMRLRPRMQPFLDDLHAVAAGGRLPHLEQVTTMLGTHIDAVTEAVAVAADVDIEWMAGLTQEEGQHLLMLWWTANGPFYVRSVFSRIAADRAVSQHAGATPTPSLSPQATETPQPSGA